MTATRHRATPASEPGKPRALQPLTILSLLFREQHDAQPTHRLVIGAIVPWIDQKTGRTEYGLSQKRIAEATGLSERSVGIAVDDLRRGFCVRKGQRIDLHLPFRFSCEPKVYKPGERRPYGRPLLVYGFDSLAPASEKGGTQAEPGPAVAVGRAGTDGADLPEPASDKFPEPGAENSGGLSERRSGYSAGDFSEAGAGLFRTGQQKFPEPASDDLREASESGLRNPVAPDGAPPLKLVHPIAGKRKAKPGKSSKVSKSSDAEPMPSAHRELLEAYCAEFRKARGVDPVMKGTPWKITCRAAKELLEAVSLEEAKSIVHVAFADPFFCKNMGELRQIVASANKYRGVARASGVQRSSEEHGAGLRSKWNARSDQKKREREVANESVR